MKWEAAIALMPEKAIIHEQKAQVLLELGEAWNALKAATRASSFASLHIYIFFTVIIKKYNNAFTFCAIKIFLCPQLWSN